MSSLGSDVPRLGFTHRGGGGIGYCGSAGPPARTFPEPWSSGRAAAARHRRVRTTRSIPEETSPGTRGHAGRERCARGTYVADGGIGRFLSSSGRLASRDRVGDDPALRRCRRQRALCRTNAIGRGGHRGDRLTLRPPRLAIESAATGRVQGPSAARRSDCGTEARWQVAWVALVAAVAL
jgi:hypothetical protein